MSEVGYKSKGEAYEDIMYLEKLLQKIKERLLKSKL